MLKVVQALNVAINPDEIEISHKVKRKNSKSMIVKFLSHRTKSRLYKVGTKLKNVKLADVFPSYANAAHSEDRIFVNESLTSFRRDHLGKANALRKDGGIISVWTIDGKIFVQTSPDGTPVRIYCEDDLKQL